MGLFQQHVDQIFNWDQLAAHVGQAFDECVDPDARVKKKTNPHYMQDASATIARLSSQEIRMASAEEKNRLIKHTDSLILSLEQENFMFRGQENPIESKNYQELDGIVNELCLLRNGLAYSYASQFLCIQPWKRYMQMKSVRTKLSKASRLTKGEGHGANSDNPAYWVVY